MEKLELQLIVVGVDGSPEARATAARVVRRDPLGAKQGVRPLLATNSRLVA